MSERVSVPVLRRLAEAWEVEVSTPGDYTTDAFHALQDVLMGSALTVVEFVDVVEAAHRANVPRDCGCGELPCPNGRLLDALTRFDFGESL